MSEPRQDAVRRAVIRGAIIETPIILGGAVASVVTGNAMWAIAAAALGTIVLFVLLAQAKKEQGW